MQKRDAKIWKFVTGKVKGGFGETDFNKKVVKIDKKKHKSGTYGGVAKQDNTLLNTIQHEKLHTEHPKMTEVQVRKLARKKVGKMSKNNKSKLYNKLNK